MFIYSIIMYSTAFFPRVSIQDAFNILYGKALLWMEPITWGMVGKHSTTEPHSQSRILSDAILYWYLQDKLQNTIQGN